MCTASAWGMILSLACKALLSDTLQANTSDKWCIENNLVTGLRASAMMAEKLLNWNLPGHKHAASSQQAHAGKCQV